MASTTNFLCEMYIFESFRVSRFSRLVLFGVSCPKREMMTLILNVGINLTNIAHSLMTKLMSS